MEETADQGGAVRSGEVQNKDVRFLDIKSNIFGAEVLFPRRWTEHDSYELVREEVGVQRAESSSAKTDRERCRKRK